MIKRRWNAALSNKRNSLHCKQSNKLCWCRCVRTTTCVTFLDLVSQLVLFSDVDDVRLCLTRCAPSLISVMSD